MATPEEQEHYRKISSTAAEADKYRQNSFGLGAIAGILWLFSASLMWQGYRNGAIALMVVAVALSSFTVGALVAKKEALKELHTLQDQRKGIKNSA